MDNTPNKPPQTAADKIQERELQHTQDLETIQKGTEAINAILARVKGTAPLKKEEGETIPAGKKDAKKQPSKRKGRTVKEVKEEINKTFDTKNTEEEIKVEGEVTAEEENEEELTAEEEKALENILATINKLEAKLAELEARKEREGKQNKEEGSDNSTKMNELETEELSAEEIETIKNKIQKITFQIESDKEDNKERQRRIDRQNESKTYIKEKIKSIKFYKPFVWAKDNLVYGYLSELDSFTKRISNWEPYLKKELNERLSEIPYIIERTKKQITERENKILELEEERRTFVEKFKKEKEEIQKDREEKPFIYYAMEKSDNQILLTRNRGEKTSLLDFRECANDNYRMNYTFMQRINNGEVFFEFNILGFIKVIKNAKAIETKDGIDTYSDNAIYKILGPGEEVIADDIHGYNEATRIYEEKSTEYEKKLKEQFEKDSKSKE